MNNNEKLKDFRDILIQLSGGITKKDFISSFKKILSIVLDIEKKLIKRINGIIETSKQEQEALKKATEADLSDLIAQTEQKVEEALKEQEESLNFVKDKARRIKNFTNGKDGKDADETKIVEKVLNKIKLPEQKEIILDNAEKIRDKLELLKENERLEITAINGLQEKLDELSKRKLGSGGGGGFSKIHFEIHHIDNELIGTGDGTTTEFTLDHLPNPIASLRIIVGNGELFQTDDWTISGKTITFLTPPPNGAKIRGSYRI